MTKNLQQIIKSGDRDLTPDSLWQHLNGNTYRIIGVAINGINNICERSFDIFGQYVRHGSFQYIHTSESIELFDYQGIFVYGGSRDLSKLVFYSGDSGRWCRSAEDFLSKKSDDYRFMKLIKKCSACGTTDFGQSSWNIGNSIFCQECWEESCADSYWEFFGKADDTAIAIGEAE